MQPEIPDVLEFGPYKLDREQRLLIKGNLVTPLAPKVFDLLLALAESEGRVLEKKALLNKLWPDTFVEEGSLTRNISTLRKVLGESPDDQGYISTVSRRGYRFVAQVNAGRNSDTRDLGPGNFKFSNSDKPVYGQITSSSYLPVAPGKQQALVWWRRGSTAPSLEGRSVSVTPFQNLSRDSSLDHFASVLTEALLGELTHVRKVKVVLGAVVASEVYDGNPHKEVIEGLRFDLHVGGSVVRIDNRVHVVADVTNPQSESQVWSHSYDRNLREVRALLEEVACSVAAEVRADLTAEEQMQSSATRVKPEAYDCYLRGRFYARRQNKDDNETAIAALERAVTIDPTFAMGYAELAQLYTWKLFLFAPHEGQWEEKAYVAVEKALALDADLAVAYLARGRLLWTPANHFPHVRAIREYRRALALEPSLDEARNQLALVYCHIGFFEEALRESQEAASTNPNNHLAVYRTAQTLAFQAKYEQARSVLRTIPQHVNPSLIGYQTAWVMYNLGSVKEATATVDQLLNEYPEDDGALFVSLQAVMAAAAGEEEAARAKIDVAAREGRGFGHFHHAAYHIAIAFALLNEVEQAIQWLNNAALDGFPCYPLFESDANLENIRNDARFAEFMAQLKLRWLEYKEML